MAKQINTQFAIGFSVVVPEKHWCVEHDITAYEIKPMVLNIALPFRFVPDDHNQIIATDYLAVNRWLMHEPIDTASARTRQDSRLHHEVPCCWPAAFLPIRFCCRSSFACVLQCVLGYQKHPSHSDRRVQNVCKTRNTSYRQHCPGYFLHQ